MSSYGPEDDDRGSPPPTDRLDSRERSRSRGGRGRRPARSRSYSASPPRRRSRSRSRDRGGGGGRYHRDRSYSPPYNRDNRGGGGRYNRDDDRYRGPPSRDYPPAPPPRDYPPRDYHHRYPPHHDDFRHGGGPPPPAGGYGAPPPPHVDPYYRSGGGGRPPREDRPGPPPGRRDGRRGTIRDEGPPGVSLLIRNVSPEITTQDLQQAFSRIGEIRDVYIPRDYHSHQPKGFAFIEYANPMMAAEARDEMDRFVIRGRELEVVFAQERRKTPQEMRGRVVNQQNHRPSDRQARSSSFERHKQREQQQQRDYDTRGSGNGDDYKDD